MLEKLDNEQYLLATAKEPYVLGVAGAGTGKTFTILGRIDYLLHTMHVSPGTILCLSYTKEASRMLARKIEDTFHVSIDVMTFHKLGLSILDEDISICEEAFLEAVVCSYFKEMLPQNPYCFYMVSLVFKKPIFTKKQYLQLLNSQEMLLLQKEMISYIRLFKTNGFRLQDFYTLFSKTRCSFLDRLSLKKTYILLIHIYQLYHLRLKEETCVDFDDMILLSRERIANGECTVPYQYVIVDEFQDISPIRFQLIQEIIKKNNATLLAVGDDYQSIYHFSGSCLETFLSFTSIYPNGKIYKIQNTYRNSQELVTIAGNFMKRNPVQIPKELTSSFHLDNPIVILLAHHEVDVFYQLLESLYQDYGTHILVLGRNRFSINRFLKSSVKLENDRLRIRDDFVVTYLTVHKSKGLEEEVVVLIDCNDSMYGFPNQIRNSPLLNVFYSSSEAIPYPEERRLFYVALTRTKSKCYIISCIHNPSVFVKELIFKDKIKPTIR